MAFFFIHYARLFYQAVAKTAVPSLITGKFVQLRNGPNDYLVFSPKEFTKYHAHIIERFCMDNGLEGKFDVKGERYSITDTAWKIMGGGKYEIDSVQKTLRLYDDSMAYGKFRKAGLAKSINSLPEYSDFRIMVE